jgi:SAM-dependent methyltransferase|tara:strand:+ start:931 stop:1602 length:672 start_codon:yes stop_codon:yes gene_type:complete
MQNKNNKFPNDYFLDRQGNNKLRLKQFELDKKFITRYKKKGTICDVGCSTGEFLSHIKWEGEKYGMEINQFAKKIASSFINFEKNIFTEKNFFDLVIFRGTIQHVDDPFYMIRKTYKALKEDGYIIFLATPNIESILYKLKNTLPVFHNYEDTIYYRPSYRALTNLLKNYNFEVIEVNFPYLNTPYCNFVGDHLKFLKNFFSKNFYPHPFWGSMMNIVAKKTL